ncbi:MAG: hypothetical protein AB1791_17360 [Chloroflexota bacterium]
MDQHKRRKRRELQAQYDILSEKILVLRQAHAAEADPSRRFQYQEQIGQTEAERDALLGQLKELERRRWRLALALFLLLLAVAILIMSVIAAANSLGGLKILDGPTPSRSILVTGEQTQVVVSARGGGLTFVWSADNGVVNPAGPTGRSVITYTAPHFPGQDVIYVEVRDNQGHTADSQTIVSIVEEGP